MDADDARHDGPVDTIVAPTTPAGDGERAVVRLSGPAAHALAATVVRVEQQPAPGRVGHGRLPLGGGAELSVMLLQWWAPHSLTGDDVAELHLVGWPVVVTELVRRLVEAGARPAERGEFTRRAVVAGKLDLAQGLAVARLVDAESVDAARAAAAVLTGDLADVHERLREVLLSTLALVEAHLDFEEEDTEAVSLEEVRAGLAAARDLALRLARCAALAPAADGETDVVLLGPPNAGKSRLALALCPDATGSVSPVPGTTRDALEARTTRDGRRFRVIDGPGVDAGASPLGELDRRAMDVFVAHLPPAAVVLHVHDVTAPSDEAGAARRLAVVGERPVIDVWTKADLLAAPDGDAANRNGVLVSAVTGRGVDALWCAVARAAPAPRAPDLAVRAELVAAADVLPVLEQALADTEPHALPIVSLALRDALAFLDQEAGADDLDEAVLDRIFASFCIGK